MYSIVFCFLCILLFYFFMYFIVQDQDVCIWLQVQYQNINYMSIYSQTTLL